MTAVSPGTPNTPISNVAGQGGDLVRLLSPSSTPDRPWLDESIRILESWGLQVDVGRHALDEHAYMAGHDHDRLADLNDAFRDPAVRANGRGVGRPA